LLKKYSMQVTSVVMVEYPEHGWMPWRFAKSQGGWWSQLAQQLSAGNPLAEAAARMYVEYLGGLHGVVEVGEYSLLSRELLGPGPWHHITTYLGGLPALLTRCYPHHNWKGVMFGAQLGKSQSQIYSTVKNSLFANPSTPRILPPKTTPSCLVLLIQALVCVVEVAVPRPLETQLTKKHRGKLRPNKK